MLNRTAFAVSAVSIYLLIFLISVSYGAINLASFLFLFSPLLVLWMVYTVIRYGVYTGKELADDEEWGYEDRKKEDHGVF